MNKLLYPTTSRQLSLKVQGIFGTPDDWKTLDDANPNLFSYTVRSFKIQIEKGKIFPRDLTAKEIREQEEKNKKGGKKETKKQDALAEQERIKKQEQEDQKKREEEWNKLSEQDRKYRDFEDAYRSPQLRFQNHTKSQVLTGKSLVIFEERIEKDQGEWVYVVKSPSVSEDELAKMRKTKPKTLSNLNDLNPIIMKAWIDYTTLYSQDKVSVTQRCKLAQVDKTPQTSEPNLQNAYIKVRLTLDQPFIKGDDGIVGEKLIPEPPVAEDVSERLKAVGQLRDEVRLEIESLAMQYAAMFWKELNIYEDFKSTNYFSTKKNDITKRKEHFLYDFNVSGKYKILKDRIKKVIVHLCDKYFTQQMGSAKSFTGVACSIKDQFYSQIYTFLVTKYKEALQELIFQKRQNLKEVEVLSQSAQMKNVQKYLAGQFKETPRERIERVIQEYQILGDFKYGEKLYKNCVEGDPSNVDIKYSYAIYCIKNRLKKADEVLIYVEEYLSYHKDDLNVLLEYLLLLIASESQDNCKKAWVFLREIINQNPTDTKLLTLASFLFSDLLSQQQVGQKFVSLSERTYLRQCEKLPGDGKHREASIASEIPNLKGLPAYSEALSAEDKDKLWVEVLKLFLNLNLFNMVDKLQPKIKATNSIIFDVIKLRFLLVENNFQQFQSRSKELYEKSKAQQILDLMVNYLLEHPNAQTQKYLKTNLIKSSGSKQNEGLLKLAYFYLNSEQYANSRSCILKYLQKKPENSGFSWRILGICEFKLGNLSEALGSLKKANVSDINNHENWIWLARIYSMKNNFIMCSQCINQYEAMAGARCGGQLTRQLAAQLKKTSSQTLCEEKMRCQLVERLTVQQTN